MKEEYKVTCLDKYGGRIHSSIKNFRSLQHREILVEVHCTTIHAFDLMFIRGEYGEVEPKSFPIVPGFEGSGRVIQVADEADSHLLGKRVACFANANKEGYFEGLWAEYHYTTAENVMSFDQDVPYERICHLINALTSVGMLDTAKKAQAKTVLLNEADSQIGMNLVRLCRKEGIETVNIIRNYSHAKDMIQSGAPNIVVCEGDWEKECKKLCITLGAELAFDLIGGDFTGKMLSFLPEDAYLYNLGSISLNKKEVSHISISDLVFQGKFVTGFWMIRWLRSLNAEEYEYWWNYIKKEFQYITGVFQPKIAKTFTLDNIHDAMIHANTFPLEGEVVVKIR